jgi:hypothetical protein
MSVQHANIGVVKKDLQLYYNREFLKSFRGEATVNTCNLNSRYNYVWANAVVTRDTTAPVAPPITGFEIAKLRSTDGLDAQTILYTASVDQVNGGIYTHSAYIYLESGTWVSVGQHWNPWNYGVQTFIPKNKWTRVSFTVTNTPNNYGDIACSYNTDGVIYITATQYEKKSYSTPFVNGTRLNTIAGGGGLLDISGNNINADLSNVSFDSNGYYFDGSASYINLGTSKTSLNISSDLTVEAVIKLTSNFTLNPTIIGNGYWQEVYPYKLQFEYNSNNGNLGLFRYDGTNYRYVLWNFGSQNTYFLNKTVHIVATYSSLTNTFAIYYNGVSQTITSSNPGNISVNNTTNFAIGAQIKTDGTKGDYFPGTINLVRVYNRALTSSEVLQNFNATRTTYGI